MFVLILLSAIVATLLVVMWLILYFKYRKTYSDMLDGIEGEGFVLKDLYFIGLGAIEFLEVKSGSKISTRKKSSERINSLIEVYGRENAELYFYVSIAAQISLIITLLPLAFMLCCILQSVIGLLLGALITFALVNGVKSSINTSINDKKDAIISEFPKMVSKLTLLINAGMLVRKAWDEVATSNYDSPLYEEMRTTSKDIQEGMAIDAAMDNFAQRCGTKEIRKFSSIYVQAVYRGASESINSMKVMADEAWENKKQYSKQKGEIASQKLLIPNMIMFVGILVIVVVPLFAQMFGSISF